MTIAVDLGRKATKQTKTNKLRITMANISQIHIYPAIHSLTFVYLNP